MEPTVFLFDMDGVLVKPGGYRAAVRATVNYFSNQLGLGDMAPPDETIAIFEAQGITCEWDMVPILIAITLEAAAQQGQGMLPLSSFAAVCDWLRDHPVDDLAIDYAGLLRTLGRYVRVGEATADSILAAALAGQAADWLPCLSGQAVLGELLAHSRHLIRSQITPVFETFALGDAVFTQATGLPAVIRSESLLVRHDYPLLTSQTRDRLRLLRDQAGLRMAGYTARPSQPASGLQEPLAVFSPEAEMALERLGWQELVVVGSGQMGEAALKLHEIEDRLTKPAPYHAIAAIAAAWTGDRQAALNWMEQVFCFYEADHPCSGVSRPSLVTSAGPLPDHLDLHIFEDSPAGMRGGQHAAELLAGLGMQVRLNLWGVSTHSEKAAALQAVGAQVFPDVNQAVEQALASK